MANSTVVPIRVNSANQSIKEYYIDYAAVTKENDPHVDAADLSRLQKKRRCFNPQAQREDQPWENYLPANHKARGGVTISFPMKLHRMLDCISCGYGAEEEYSRIVSWLPHGRAFMVHDAERFEKILLPVFFGENMKYHSFKRQLNLYEFKRIVHGLDENGYYHELCLRGRPFLCYRMKRKKIKGRKNGFKPKTPVTPNFYDMPMPILKYGKCSGGSSNSFPIEQELSTSASEDSQSALSMLCGVAAEAGAMSPDHRTREWRDEKQSKYRDWKYFSDGDSKPEEHALSNPDFRHVNIPVSHLPPNPQLVSDVTTSAFTSASGVGSMYAENCEKAINRTYMQSFQADKVNSRQSSLDSDDMNCHEMSTIKQVQTKLAQSYEPTNCLTLLKAASLVELEMNDGENALDSASCPCQAYRITH